MAEFEDEVTRACTRNGVLPGSDLERELRLNIWAIAGNDYSEDRDRKIDRFLKQQKANPNFADSLVKKPKPGPKPEPVIDTLNLTPSQFEEIATGKVRLG